jgi:hypothetical protein
MEGFCSPVAGGLSVLTTALIVTGVLVVCVIVGGLVLAKVVKKRKNLRNTPEYCDIYVPSASYNSGQLYEEVGSGQSCSSVKAHADVR